MNWIVKLMEWIPGCSPNIPRNWQEVGIQAATCVLRWLIFAGTAIILYRLAGVSF